MPEEDKPRPPHRLPWFWIVLLLVLSINWAALLMAQSSGQPRVRVPFSPYFLRQVEAGRADFQGGTALHVAGEQSDERAPVCFVRLEGGEQLGDAGIDLRRLRRLLQLGREQLDVAPAHRRHSSL